MKFVLRLILAALLVFQASEGSAQEIRTVRRVYDGDTVILDRDQKVRLIGVDTPEMKNRPRNAKNAARYGIPAAEVEAYAKKARSFVEDCVLGQKVILEYDGEKKDRFGRTLAYLYRQSDGLFLNEELVRQGYAFAYTRFSFRYREQFKKDEEVARRSGVGFWASAKRSA